MNGSKFSFWSSWQIMLKDQRWGHTGRPFQPEMVRFNEDISEIVEDDPTMSSRINYLIIL